MPFKEETSAVSDWELAAIVGEIKESFTGCVSKLDESFTSGGSNEPTVVSFSLVAFLPICSDGLFVQFRRSCRQLGLVGVLGCESAPRSLGNLLGRLPAAARSLLKGNFGSTWSGRFGNCQGVVGAELAVSG